MTTIDFTKALQDAKGVTFEALPIGDYDIEVTKAEAVQSQNGKPMIKTNMKVIAGPYERRPIINNFVLSIENPQAVAIFFRHMKCFGITEEFFAALGANGSLDPVANALIQRRARLTLGHREWNGEMRNEVKGVKPYTGAPPMAGPGTPTGPAGPMPAGPAPMAGPIAGPTPPLAAPPAPVPAPAPAPVVAPLSVAAPAVQAMPQPPAPAPEVPVTVPTSAPSVDSSAAVASPSSAPTEPTSEAPVVAPAPPALPF